MAMDDDVFSVQYNCMAFSVHAFALW